MRVLAVLYPVLTAVVVLATANHFVLDVVAGALLWALADAAARKAIPLRVSWQRADPTQ